MQKNTLEVEQIPANFSRSIELAKILQDQTCDPELEKIKEISRSDKTNFKTDALCCLDDN